MSFSRSVTIAGWIVIGISIATATIAAFVSRARFPSAVVVLRAATRHVVGRMIALAAWTWIGWHFFVRTSR